MRIIFCCYLFAIALNDFSFAQQIDRRQLVTKHNVIVTKADSLSSLSVGNGRFAFTVDVTGLQSFPEFYANGVPLGTQSEWGWHSFINTNQYRFEESLKTYRFHGRDVSYPVQWNENGRNKDAANWFRQNPHRLQLGNIGLEIKLKNGTPATIHDIKGIKQTLDLWNGAILSAFTVEDIPVTVGTICDQNDDLIKVIIFSRLINEKRLQIRMRFPYPTGEWMDVGTNWHNGTKQSSMLNTGNNRCTIERIIDSTKYYVHANWNYSASVSEKEKNYFLIDPATNSGAIEISFRFSQTEERVVKQNNFSLSSFWEKGAAIDFSGSTDPRANELERRIILSQYLLRIQEAGSYPPQETGLTYNSWFGKPHLEMHWWHAVQYALLGRIELLERSLDWYKKVFPKAQQIASRQRYHAGGRWQKMTDHDGNESPSSVGSFLIWQQPHFIYFAELCYREHKDKATLEKYKHLVIATADFMASYAFYDQAANRYILGKGLIPAQERFKPEQTFNPTYELAYWNWGLSTAQKWLERLNLPRNKKWDEVINKLSPLPHKDNVYLAAESAPDSYTNPQYKTDHPSVLGTYGMLPYSKMLDTVIMKKTFATVWNTWQWHETWGWDFPMTAMTAARLNLPEKAIDALMMNIQTNHYLVNGHNYQDERLRIYLPGNGGLLTAIAMMCAGWDGSKKKNPGIPDNGKWKVKWEGLRRMP